MLTFTVGPVKTNDGYRKGLSYDGDKDFLKNSDFRLLNVLIWSVLTRD